MTDGNYNLLNIRTKMTTINKSTKVSTLKQLSGVYYIGSRHGIAYLRDEHDENISLMSVHSSAKNYVTQETHLYNPPELTNKENMELTLNFPNGVSFKAIFRKDEQIKDVVKFVKPYLTEKMQPFYFYTLYPRLIMPYNKVLKDISFMPPYNQLQVSFGREYNPKVNYLKKEIIRSLKKNPFTSMLSQMFSKE
ncbi:hypothetical protein O3M35_011021 [Rhynocoris fuscipes]|uniref:UBX domain-containing protein n=1 Tax=Rhynocoris fuscipes TaxID=488301 RepID=A0AAW1CWP2_9HEMI